MKNLLYLVGGFDPPIYAFTISLLSNFAKRAFERELSKDIFENLQKEGSEFMGKHLSQIPVTFDFQPYVFLNNSSSKRTCLVSHVKVLGPRGDRMRLIA